MILKTIYPLILLVCAFNTKAQTNNFWVDELGGSGYTFDSNGNLKVFDNLKNLPVNTNGYFSISDWQGNPKLFSCGYYTDYLLKDSIPFLYNTQNQAVTNSDSLCIGMRYGFLSMSFDTSKYLIFGIKSSNQNYQQCIYFSIIQPNLSEKSGFQIKTKHKNIPLFFKDTIIGLSCVRNSKAQSIFVVRTKAKFYSIKVNSDLTFNFLDSLNYSVHENIPDSFKNIPYYYNRSNDLEFACPINFSNNGNYFTFFDAYLITDYFREERFKSLKFQLMEFNSETGSFIKINTIYENFTHDFKNNLDKKNLSISSSPVFSTNNLFLYFTTFESDKNYSSAFRKTSIYQCDINNLNLTKIHESDYENVSVRATNLSKLNLNHKGEIFYFSMKNNSNREFEINKILYPNKPFPECQYKENIQSIPTNFGGNYAYTNFIFDYLRIKKSVQYDCKASVQIKNTSLPEIGFTKFTWHIVDENGVEQYYNSFEPPILNYRKSGNYCIKLFGYSPSGNGYGEWYIDTIKVEIPDKPIADFYTNDSIICRYNFNKFYNYSSTKDSLSNNYKWDFGDGNSSILKSPTHIYKDPGQYTVTLNFHNGYCDSTLVKQLYINVIDAPKPGFIVDKINGCAPLEIQITDTNSRYVSKKSYWIDPETEWMDIPISSSQFTYTFKKAGNFYIKQKLYGFSTCITQFDSILIKISPGLTDFDSINIINASVEQNGIELNWQKNNAAISYNVFKDNVQIANTIDTFTFLDLNYNKDAIFHVIGIDSCGNKSTFDRIGKPVFLQTKMIGYNDAAILTFSKYLKWEQEPKTYFIQKLNGEIWENINNQNLNTEYIDNNFLIKNQTQACYRIEAISEEGVISHSNLSCLDYYPVIFIPNAFSANKDQINDVFSLDGYGLISYSIKIYNRWGQMVFEGGANESWDAQNCIEGVYLAFIEYTLNTGEKQNTKVTITLLK